MQVWIAYENYGHGTTQFLGVFDHEPDHTEIIESLDFVDLPDVYVFEATVRTESVVIGVDGLEFSS